MIAQLRKRAGYTQETLSEALGFGRQYISRIESGARRPSWKFITAFADLLRISPTELLRRAGYVGEGDASEAEVAALIAANPAFAEIFEFAREHPEKLAEVVRYARYLISQGEKSEGGDTRVQRPQPRRRAAMADS